MRMNISRLLLILGLIVLVGAVAASYYRSFVAKEYNIQYESTCDPQTESCFYYECTEEDGEDCESYAYALMQKHANDLYAACGDDVTSCEAAALCLPSDRACERTYCDPESEVCAIAESEPSLEEDMLEEEPSTEESS